MRTSRYNRCYTGMKPYVTEYKWRTIIAVMLCMPIGALDAVIAISLKPYTDLIMVEKVARDIWYIPVAILLFAMIQGALIYLATYLNAWVGEKMTRDLKYALYEKLIRYETKYFDKTRTGDVIYKYDTQVDMASTQLLSKIKLLVSRIFSSLSLVGVLIYNSWQLSIIALLRIHSDD